jgi:RNA polymerase sigma factor (sigma-70 family)
MSKLKSGEAAELLLAYKASPTSYATNTLVAKFQPLIEATACQICPLWKTDLMQEGNIALINAANKITYKTDPRSFLDYAYKSIKRGMLYFIRSNASKQPKHVSSLDAIFEKEGNNVFQIPHPIDYLQTTTLSIDCKILLNKIIMSKHQFSDKEVKAFDLHFNKEYNVSEVAKKLNISVSQASKILTKTKAKAQQLLAHTANKNLN